MPGSPTGNCEGPSRIGALSWITATGQWACWTSPPLTEPSRARCTASCPRQPTTMMCALSDSSMRHGTGAAHNSSLSMPGRLPHCTLSSATLIASAMSSPAPGRVADESQQGSRRRARRPAGLRRARRPVQRCAWLPRARLAWTTMTRRHRPRLPDVCCDQTFHRPSCLHAGSSGRDVADARGSPISGQEALVPTEVAIGPFGASPHRARSGTKQFDGMATPGIS